MLKRPVLTLFAIIAVSGAVFAADTTVWNPAKTRVFIACLATFQGEKSPSFSTDDRLDGKLAELFRARGVPARNMLVLLDKYATTQNIEAQFKSFLSESQPDELLIFYFGSHGDYDAKTGDHYFITYDGRLNFNWAFDAIEKGFKGSRALMFADCCYSGGIGDIAPHRDRRVSYVCISSAFCHNIAYSGWRFIDCMMRGFGGSPVVDLDGNGKIELQELANFMARHMAFVAEGKVGAVSTGSFNPHMVISTCGPKGDRRIGTYVEAKDSDGEWYKAEIVGVRGNEFHVKGTDQQSRFDRWLPLSDVKAFTYPRFAKGTSVSVESSGKWYPATVLDQWENLTLIHYSNYTAAYDEWVGPSRIKRVP